MLRELQKIYKPCLMTTVPPLDDSGAGSRVKGASMASIKRELRPLLDGIDDAGRRKLLLAVLFLAHDYVGHAWKQLPKKESADGHYVRGLILRRQGDYALASFHFRNIGAHPLLLKMTESVQADALIRPVVENFPGLLKKGTFNPPALTGIVQQVCQGGHVSLNALVQRVQALELIQVLRYIAKGS